MNTDNTPTSDAGINQNADAAEVAELNKGLGLPQHAESDAAEPEDGEEDDAPTKVDTELDSAASEDEREAIRVKRRAERKNRKDHAKEKQASLERTVAGLKQTVETQSAELFRLKNVSQGAQLQQLDEAIVEADRAQQHFKALIADATTKGDGATAADATVAMINAAERAKQLKGHKAAVSRPVAKTLDPQMVNHAKDWLGRHSWYTGPQSADPDSRVLSALDNSLAAEGWDPKTKEYWQELDSRAAKYLPHRANAAGSPSGSNTSYTGANGTREASKNPVAGGSNSGNSNNGGSGKTIGLSAERVKAIKDAGAWDDSARRDKMIKRYQQYDKDQA